MTENETPTDVAIRPVLHLDLNSSVWSVAGTVSTDGTVDEKATTGTGGTGGGAPVAISDGTVTNPRITADDVVTWDCVWFGRYRQEDTNGDGVTDDNDGLTPIKWRVLSATEDDLFLLSDKCLDKRTYNDKNMWIDYACSAIRRWLNGYRYDLDGGSFIDRAFTSSEKAAIKTTEVDNNNLTQGYYNSANGYDSSYDSIGGLDTSDKLFLLSYAEVTNKLYGFSDKKSRMSQATTYSKWKEWWLRSPYSDAVYAMNVESSGYVFLRFVCDGVGSGVRPALHISPSSSLLSYAGTVCSDGTADQVGGGDVTYYSSDLKITGFVNTSLKYTETTTDDGLQECDITTQEASIFLAPKVTGWAEYKLYTDKACTMECGSALQGLSVGENVFYVKITEGDRQSISVIKVIREKTAWEKYLGSDSRSYDHKLSRFCAQFAWAAEQGDDSSKIDEVYSAEGFDTEKDVMSVDYSDHWAYSIGCKDIGETNLVLITARGTHQKNILDLAEVIKDRAGPVEDSFFSDYTDGVYEYAQFYEGKIYKGLQDFFGARPELRDKNVRFIITGHSLGGAAANLLAARLDILAGRKEGLGAYTSSKHIYAYTFGAIDSITAANRLYGFENIHNIYNYFDSYGPNGDGWVVGLKPSGASSIGRFGNNERFARKFNAEDNISDNLKVYNHLMEQYIRAIEDNDAFMAESLRLFKNVAVLCPVDVEVLRKGEVVGRVKDDVVDESVTTIPMYVNNGHKYAAFPGTDDYEVRIKATGDGTMEYFVEDYGEDGDDLKLFENIEIKSGDEFVCEATGNIKLDDVRLYAIDTSGNRAFEVQTDGKKIKVDTDVSGNGVRVITSYKGGTLIVGDVASVSLNRIDPAKITARGKAGTYSAGIVRAVKKGKIKLIAPVLSGKKYKNTAVCVIQVEAPKLRSAVKMKCGKSKTMRLSGTKRSAVWKSSDESVVRVYSNGIVEALKPGTAVITATIGIHTYTTTVTVN